VALRGKVRAFLARDRRPEISSAAAIIHRRRLASWATAGGAGCGGQISLSGDQGGSGEKAKWRKDVGTGGRSREAPGKREARNTSKNGPCRTFEQAPPRGANPVGQNRVPGGGPPKWASRVRASVSLSLIFLFLPDGCRRALG
jgi:hypothetical protein